jgi:hypothetical protein
MASVNIDDGDTKTQKGISDPEPMIASAEVASKHKLM